jgi:excisionase family DNA binding protein
MIMKNKNLIMKMRVSSENSLTVSTEEAADLLGVCPRTVRNLTKRGELPAVRLGSCVRYSREYLIDFVRQGSRQESTDFSPS